MRRVELDAFGVGDLADDDRSVDIVAPRVALALVLGVRGASENINTIRYIELNFKTRFLWERTRE